MIIALRSFLHNHGNRKRRKTEVENMPFSNTSVFQMPLCGLGDHFISESTALKVAIAVGVLMEKCNEFLQPRMPSSRSLWKIKILVSDDRRTSSTKRFDRCCG